MFEQMIDIVYSCLTSYAVHFGTGRHAAELTSEEALLAAKWSHLAMAVAIFTFSSPKVAIALLLAGIMNNVKLNQWEKILLYGAPIFLLLLGFVVEGLWLGRCRPIDGCVMRSLVSGCQ